MRVVYGTTAPEDIFATQLRYLPEGPTGTFLGVERKADGVPDALRDLLAKVETGQIDRADAEEAFSAMLKARAKKTVDFVRS